MKTFAFFITLFFACALTGRPITFEKTRIVYDAPLETREMKADFKFKNTSSENVEIIAITTDCDCTIADLEKKVYAPGESGVISSVFTFGYREGESKKVILVTTDVQERHPIELEMVAKIKTLLTITPRMLAWRKGAEKEAKLIQVAVPESDQFKLVFEPAVPEHFDMELKSNDKGLRQYVFTPHSTGEPLREDLILKIVPTKPDDNDGFETMAVKKLYLMVR